ncbi:outer membrane beta-barrel protein [Sphingobacterium spiritivorum]|uniref:outer membrane beta-barrel protein n=1 Tax=Sphingobacterium spiritivorum TaxID=258 RepID=UPI001917B292|nr:outer membrane beta-barrel protein [Sphingobacterium spiritivorum]QQT25470.1 porin family protein [Sphingobacterium spiritivorum]
MKKLFLTLTAITALTFAANAQTEKGKFIVGGQVGFSTSKIQDTDIKSSSFSIMPQVGYFVSDNFAIGTGIGYEYNKSETTTENVNDAFKVAPYGRYYLGEGPVKFFGQLTVPMAWGNQKVDDVKTNKTTNYGVEVAPGFAYFPTSKIGIEFKVRGLYYNHGQVENIATDTKVKTNTFGLDANSLAPTIGVQFHF